MTPTPAPPTDLDRRLLPVLDPGDVPLSVVAVRVVAVRDPEYQWIAAGAVTPGRIVSIEGDPEPDAVVEVRS